MKMNTHDSLNKFIEYLASKKSNEIVKFNMKSKQLVKRDTKKNKL